MAWIEVYEKNGIIYITGIGQKEFKGPKNVKSLKEKAKLYARKYKVPERLFIELIKAESNFNPKAVSKKGAMGLCQLMPKTARQLGVKDPFDPDQNLEAGARYLRELYLKYRDWKLALAAYNAGEGTVDRYGRKVPPFKETLNYVKRILKKGKFKRKYRIVTYRKGDTIVISNVWEE